MALCVCRCYHLGCAAPTTSRCKEEGGLKLYGGKLKWPKHSLNRGDQSPEVFEKGNSFACFLNQVTMAVTGSLAVPNCSSGHLPTLLPMSRGCAQVPVDQKPGPRIRSFQLSCQGSVLPCRVLRAHEGKLLEGPRTELDGGFRAQWVLAPCCRHFSCNSA